MVNTSLQRKFELIYKKSMYEILYELYVERHMTMQEVAAELDVNLRTVQRWMKQHEIPTRKMTWI